MTKYLFLPIFLFVLFSCSNQKPETNDEPEKTTGSIAFTDQFIDGLPINHYLKNPDLPEIVKLYYYNQFSVEENDSTNSLMNILITPDEKFTPFYFKCFMNICQNASPKLSPYLGKKCISLLEDNTHYCINKLKKGSPDYFTGLVANEIYQQESWEDEINNLSLRLHLNLENDAPELRKELDLFIVGVKNDIEHMK